MKLQSGKKYMRRNGTAAKSIRFISEGLTYPYVDEEYRTYTEEGVRVLSFEGKPIETEWDIVSLRYDKQESEKSTDPSVICISTREYNRLKEIESTLREFSEFCRTNKITVQ